MMTIPVTQFFLRAVGVASLLMTLPTLSGCTVSQNTHQQDYSVWSIGEIVQALENGEQLASGPSLVMPEGISPASIILSRPDGTNSLRVQPAFAEGRTAAYVTAAVWLNIPKVWLQPAYIQVENWPISPIPVMNAPFLIDVQQKSLFYSPFWNIHLAVVGPNSSPDRFRSTRELLDANPPIPVHFRGPDNYALSPVGFLPTPAGTHLMDPTWGFELEDIEIFPARFNGEERQLLDLGSGTFRSDALGLVEPLPFFVFARPTPDGQLIAISAPRVAGVGPIGSDRQAPIFKDPDSGRDEPVLGMLWNLVLVNLPPEAAAFERAAHPTSTVPSGYDIREFEGRVALNAACFDPTTFPTGCSWLDSQSRIEGALKPTDLVPTNVSVNSVFMSIDKSATEI